MKKHESVSDLFEHNHRLPLKAGEIEHLVNKSKASIYKEIKNLMKREELQRIEIPLLPFGLGGYKLIVYMKNNGGDNNGNELLRSTENE